MKQIYTHIMKVDGRWNERFVVVVLLALLLAGLPVASASAAGSNCAPRWHDADVCIHVNNGAVYGDALHYTGKFSDITLYVKQCRVDHTNCVTIAANHITNYWYIRTSTKSAAYGHAFIACASWTDNLGYHITNRCSGWRTWP